MGFRDFFCKEGAGSLGRGMVYYFLGIDVSETRIRNSLVFSWRK